LGSFGMAREWTDWSPPDAVAVAIGPALVVNAFGLLELATMVQSVTRGSSGVDR
jgi:hypothetical protein